MTQYALALFHTHTKLLGVEVVAADSEKDAIITLLMIVQFPDSCLEVAKKVETSADLIDVLSTIGIHVVVCEVPTLN